MNNRLLRPKARGGWTFVDSDARAYAQLVYAADGQVLEVAVGQAIDNFVIGCKADGIWTAMVSTVLLAGPRTLSGALVPLKGTAPSGFGFVQADYNRETGLLGNGSTKYLDSNRNNNADGQNDFHMAAWQTTIDTAGTGIMGCGGATAGASGLINNGTAFGGRSRTSTYTEGAASNAIGLVGVNRSASGTYNRRANATNNSVSVTSQTPLAGNIFVFGLNVGGSVAVPFSGRLAFYSIGANLTLSTLEARVSTYLTAIAAAIP